MYRYAAPAAAPLRWDPLSPNLAILPAGSTNPATQRSRRAANMAMVDRRRRGMGVTLQQADPQAGAIAAVAASTATSVVGTLVALGAVTGPVGAAIAGVIAAAYAIANLFGGCGNTCVAATHIADQAGAIIDQAFNQYMSAPIHYASMQTAYLQLFDGTMAAMDKACGDPSLGAAGQRCISERKPGVCTFKTPAGAWARDAAGEWAFDPNAGPLCWNSYAGRRDPVANDPTVVPDPGGASSMFSSAGGGRSFFGVPAPLAIGAALLGLAWWASE